MNYKVYTPSADLQPFVKCFWTLEGQSEGTQPTKQRIIPDGWIELIIHYGDPYRQYLEDGSSIIQPRSFVFGQLSNYVEIEPTGRSGIIAARFLPEGLMPFLKVPVSSLHDKAMDLVTLFGEGGQQLESSVLEADRTVQRIQQIEKFLFARLKEQHTIDTIIRNCVDVILRTQGQLGIRELADKMHINRRNLEQKFSAAVGLSPKQLVRVVRLQSTIKMLEHGHFKSLTSLAHENGYYDQAHFIRDFREFTGMSPKLYYSHNSKFAALFV